VSSMSQICPGVDTLSVLLLHLPACLLAVVPVALRRCPLRSRGLELVFDSMKHVVGAVSGHALLLCLAPLLCATTGWASPCAWYVGISGVESTLGLALQMWVVVGPLNQLGRRYPQLVTGQYWDPRTNLRSPKRFGKQLALWVGLALSLRVAASTATLVLATPLAIVAASWGWLLGLGRPLKLLLVAVAVPAANRAMQFLVMDPLMEASVSEEDSTMWRPLHGGNSP